MYKHDNLPSLHDAAPDLLEACIEALSLFDNYPECHEASGTYQVLNAAISRAIQQGEPT